MPITFASSLYAISQQTKNDGDTTCHWCGSCCKRLLRHDEPTPPMFTKIKSTGRVPSSPYICLGCWLWRRKSITVQYLDGGYKDRQSPINWSWWITEKGSWVINSTNTEVIRDVLLKPPRCFCLIVKEKDKPNNIHQAVINEPPFEIKANTPLQFTYGNTVHNYNIYELGEALRYGSTGKDPGVQILVKQLWLPRLPLSEENPEKRKQGRPTEEDANYSKIKQTIIASGMPS